MEKTTLNQRDRETLHFLTNNPATLYEVAEHFSCSETTVKRSLAILLEYGLIKKTGFKQGLRDRYAVAMELKIDGSYEKLPSKPIVTSSGNSYTTGSLVRQMSEVSDKHINSPTKNFNQVGKSLLASFYYWWIKSGKVLLETEGTDKYPHLYENLPGLDLDGEGDDKSTKGNLQKLRDFVKHQAVVFQDRADMLKQLAERDELWDERVVEELGDWSTDLVVTRDVAVAVLRDWCLATESFIKTWEP